MMFADLSLKRVSKVLVGGLLAASLVFTPIVTMPASAAARGPDSLADVVDQVLDAVVNISASTTVNEQRSVQMPQLPPGSPFQDFFEDFFRNGPGEGQGQQQGRPQRRSNSLGSGFVIDPSGVIITNAHVIGEANDVTVIFADGRKLKAEIVGKDTKVDLAVLRVKPDKPLKAVKFGDSRKTERQRALWQPWWAISVICAFVTLPIVPRPVVPEPLSILAAFLR